MRQGPVIRVMPIHRRMERRSRSRAPRSGNAAASMRRAISNIWARQPAERHFKDGNGNFVHRRVPYRRMKRVIADGGKMTMPEAQAEMGLTPWVMMPKERWFLDLGAK